MRNAFSAALVHAARKDPRVLLLTGDHGYALFDEIRRVCPDQYVNAGVAEQNMVGVAAGLAKGGFRPIVYGLSAFVPVRVLEQIKMDVCYESLPVIFIGDGAGVVYSTLGTSHQSTEDVAAARGVPGLSILSPADAAEMTAAMELALAADGPVYLRMGKSDLSVVHSSVPDLQWGRMVRVQDGGGPLAGWRPARWCGRRWPRRASGRAAPSGARRASSRWTPNTCRGGVRPARGGRGAGRAFGPRRTRFGRRRMHLDARPGVGVPRWRARPLLALRRQL